MLINKRERIIVGASDRSGIERAFGAALPHGEWLAYAVEEHLAQIERRALLLRYDGATLTAFEFVTADAAAALRRLQARDYGAFRLLPGAVGIGDRPERLDDAFGTAADEPPAVGGQEVYRASFAGGCCIAEVRDARLARLAVYAEGIARLRF